MKIRVDQEKCIGCGLCVSLCPDTFKMSDEGKSEVMDQSNVECATRAVNNCPVSAIIISE
jgi:ferredoxin